MGRCFCFTLRQPLKFGERTGFLFRSPSLPLSNFRSLEDVVRSSTSHRFLNSLVRWKAGGGRAEGRAGSFSNHSEVQGRGQLTYRSLLFTGKLVGGLA